ncbi:PREDICTED: caspase-1-like [Nicrophorus vespilloides]|uniref:Caspase-1-like n=1 Tax=Nicrophorus vespilloides TaxID=110193 RepID=A0ABM1N2S3_NICVS|nr:PREDICTED: caspase-1-like [Nicrophorus vespilloides]
MERKSCNSSIKNIYQIKVRQKAQSAQENTNANDVSPDADQQLIDRSNDDEKNASGSTAAKGESNYYNMNHDRRGIALIFNHYKFDNSNLSIREGTDKDCQNIDRTLTTFNFTTKVCQDYTYRQIVDIIYEVSNEDHSDADCLMIVVMSHGDAGVIHARDHQYTPDQLWLQFSGNNCPTLVGKPKLFFIQACRGNKLDPGVTVYASPGDANQNTYKIPAMADFLIMYSSFEGHISFRSTVSGSWLIRSLCDELQHISTNNTKTDLLTILTFVNRRIANYEVVAPEKDFDEMKQIGSIVSSLTKILHLYKKIDK